MMWWGYSVMGLNRSLGFLVLVGARRFGCFSRTDVGFLVLEGALCFGSFSRTGCGLITSGKRGGERGGAGAS
jgi:hypothetical protein